MNPRDRRALPALGYLLATMGRRDEARTVLRELEQMNTQVRNCVFQIAVVHAGLGEDQKALEKLEHGYRTKQAAMPAMTTEYRFHSIRQYPRFQAILSQLGLKPST